jgi:ABC-2 type transport system ATP-binding protein
MPVTGTPLLAARDISRRYGRLWALRGASFTVHGGEVVGLIGPNGAGKTTLFECVAGTRPATAGHVEIGGTVTSAEHRKQALFFLPDGVRPWRDQPVSWVLEFARGMYGRSEPVDTGIIDALGISRLMSQRLHSLSKGEHKRVMLALALSTSQSLLLLDEPFDGLDLRQTRDAMQLLRGQATRGRTLLLSIHQLADAERTCDRFVLLSAGITVAEGSLAELRATAGVTRDDASLDEVFLALT